MSEPVLLRYSRRLSPSERDAFLDDHAPAGVDEEPVHRANGAAIPIGVFEDLMYDLGVRRERGDWDDDRAASDRWLAPRVHHALRLTRDLASDRRMWDWLSVQTQTYLDWRWFDQKTGTISEDRWHGPIHKQAFARLWWGAELFRDGPDYRPVERAFVRQDLVNSYLHRPLVRCRSLALGILDVVAPAQDPAEKSSTDVNNLARVLNLATAGAPPELETGMQQDDWTSYTRWATQTFEAPANWDRLPDGPPAKDTTAESLSGGLRVALRGWAFATGSRS